MTVEGLVANIPWNRWCSRTRLSLLVGIALGCSVSAAQLAAMEQVTFLLDGRQRMVTGQIVAESPEGGLLLQGQDNTLWAITSDQVQERLTDDRPFTFLTHQQLGQQLLEELPGFQIHTTAHYVICYNTSRAYAQWCGALFERLQRAFMNYWSRQGLQLHAPPPLPAVVFQNRSSYEAYGKQEVGDAIRSIIGHYNMHTNRIAMYDLTGVDRAATGVPPRSSTHINQVLSLPAAEHTVATIVHEATHQLAYSCGLQQRYADVPMWLNEGLAIYFETPDLRSSRGWATIGTVNRYRLNRFQRFLPQRPQDSLISLLINDQRFRESQYAEDAYAEAWAFCFFLIRTRPEQFVRYLQRTAALPPLQTLTAEQRLKEFREVFGDDLRKLEVEFLRHISRLR